MKLSFSLILIGTLTAILAQSQPKSLQVLDVENKGELKQIMEGISDDLGVKCVFCHNMRDKSSDEKQHKVIAREMLKMVSQLNSDFFTWDNAEKVTCWTCHQGYKEPPKKSDDQ